VKFSPSSIIKNDKSDREKNCKYFANGSSDFNRTEKFGINTKNYTRKESKINNLDQGWNIGIRQENRTTKRKVECNQEKDRRNTTSIEMIM
jgi:hypothetical protein